MGGNRAIQQYLDRLHLAVRSQRRGTWAERPPAPSGILSSQRSIKETSSEPPPSSTARYSAPQSPRRPPCASSSLNHEPFMCSKAKSVSRAQSLSKLSTNFELATWSHLHIPRRHPILLASGFCSFSQVAGQRLPRLRRASSRDPRLREPPGPGGRALRRGDPGCALDAGLTMSDRVRGLLDFGFAIGRATSPGPTQIWSHTSRCHCTCGVSMRSRRSPHTPVTPCQRTDRPADRP